MEEFSEITEKITLPVAIEVAPFLRDHRFEDRAVLPAVEAMRILAASAKTRFPDADVRRMGATEFNRFLYIPEESKTLPAFNEIERREDGRIRCQLTTKSRSRAGITRKKSHVTLFFDPPGEEIIRIESDTPGTEAAPFEIPADRLYEEMVPFGPGYRNLVQRALLWEDFAEAWVRAPAFNDGPDALGSPFPLDGAFHLACAWGQRYAGIVAFPVGMEGRHILRPTRPGNVYGARVKPRIHPAEIETDLLIFDIHLFDDLGPCEQALGVRMRDVSRGRMRPPDWVRKR